MQLSCMRNELICISKVTLERMKYMIIGLFLLFAGNLYAQVRGTVKDSTGEAIPGANVFWMNTGQGVTTKEDGSFLL